MNKEIIQTITSKETSINTLNKSYKDIVDKYPRATTILDFGCGKYNKNMEFAEEHGFIWFGVDPYNRSEEWNNDNIKAMYNWCDAPDIIMCNNVLNVIKENKIIFNILNQIYEYAGDKTDVYITIYEGDKSSIGNVTSKGYQRNQKVGEYKSMISEFFDIFEVKGNIIKARKVV